MEIWLDTVNLETIVKAEEMGILHGVTTNPSLLAKSGQPFKKVLENLLLAQKGAVTFQVTPHEPELMIRQAQEIYDSSNRIMIKVPVTAQGLKVITSLVRLNIPVMATAVFDPNQVLFAAKAGATYIAPYYSRICEADVYGIDAVKSMLHLLSRHSLPSKLIAASLRTPEQVKECAEMGCHAVTLNESVFAKCMEDHPSTKEAVARFTKDWKSYIS